MSEKKHIPNTALLLELGELHSQVLHTQSTLETKISLIKAAIENEEYLIHPERIIEQMLGEQIELGALDEDSSILTT